MNSSCSNLAAYADFGDKRLNKRLEKLSNALSESLKDPITSASKDQASIKGAYRFLDHKKVNYSKIISSNSASFLPELLSVDRPQRILMIDDTVELDYTGKKGASDLGPLNFANRRGVNLHNSLIMSCKGVPLGISKQTYQLRDEADFGQSQQRRDIPLAQKESYRWYDHFQTAQNLCKDHPLTELVYIADREADFMELLCARHQVNMHFVIRSQYDRNLANDELKLRQRLASCLLQGRHRVNIQHPTTKKRRIAQLEIRFTKLTLELVAKHPTAGQLPGVTTYAIEVREVNPPADIDQPIYWVLLTTLEVENLEQALLIIKYYTWRWVIERFHYLLKTGAANVEKLQLHKAHRIFNAVAIYSIAVMNVMKIRYLAQHEPETKIDETGISSIEHEALYTYIHHQYDKKVIYNADHIPTIKEYCIVLAKLGGFYPSKRQPLPGLKVLTRAFDKYELIVKNFSIFMSKNL